MGLDTTHNCWHGAYSAYMRWREQLAHLAELPPLMLMEGFYSPETGPIHMARSYTSRIDSEREGLYFQNYMNNLPIKWDVLRPDPVLYQFLYHSDCDGSLSHDLLEPLAVRLEELLALAPDELDLGGHIGNFQQKTRQFIDGLRLAHSLGEDVEYH